MTPQKRTALVRWVLIAAVLAAVVLQWPDLHTYNLVDWLLLGSLTLLVAAIHNLGIITPNHEITFLPVAALMTYLTLGSQAALLALTTGLLLGGVVRLLRQRKDLAQMFKPWGYGLSGAFAAVARNGVSLLAAHWSYVALEGMAPLRGLSNLQAVLPIVALTVIYLLIYDLILAVDFVLRDLKIIQEFTEYRRALLAMQMLPLALAPFSAIALASLGFAAFVIFEIVLLTIAVVVNRMVIAQESLQHRVKQLSSFSAVSRALRTSLDLSALLETIYLQVANLIQVKNFHIVLSEQDGTQVWFPFAVERGKLVSREPSKSDNDFRGWVMRERVPLLASDMQATAERLHLNPLPGVQSWMGVPLMASDRSLGCMYVWLEESPETGARVFTEDDLELFIAVALQAGVAIENAQLYKAAQQQAAQLATLNQISTVMNASLNPDRVLELVSDSAIKVAGCNRAAIYLLETNTPDPSLLLAHAQGFSPVFLSTAQDIAIPLDEEERERVMKQGKPNIVTDVLGPDASLNPAAMLQAKQEGYRAYTYLPLRAQKEAIGILAVYHDEPHTFSENEIELLETFANQAALAVINARIYQRVDIQLARRVEQIVRMADINRRLSATLELERVFDLIIDSAMEGCRATSGVLVLVNDNADHLGDEGLNMVAWRGFDPSVARRAPHHVAEQLVNSKVLQSGETQLVSDQESADNGPRSQLGVPILLEDRVIGAIALESDKPYAFSGEDVTFVSQLAVQAAVAIRNAQLYQRAQVVRDRLHAILDASGDGLLMIDPQSRIVMTNTRMGDFWDFARQDFSPRSPDEFLADPLTALGEGLGYREGELSALLARGIRNPNMPSETDLYVAKGRETGQRRRFVERSATPVHDEQGSFIGLLLIFRDVTEQKELEETRENLTSMIVHDLRAPLQAIMGSMRLVEELVPNKDPVVEQATEVSGRAIKKLLNLVNNLLDMSRMERGEFTLDLAVESIPAILEDAAADLMPLAKEVDAVLKVEVADSLPEAYIDRDMIERVVLNLLDNALKFAPPGELVQLCADIRRATTGQKENMIQVRIIDRGPGVPDEYKEYVFDRFAQVPGHKGRRRSAGMGLAFCQMAVESHGGKIWVEDNRDGGSIFAFTVPISTLPLVSEEESPSQDKEASTAAKDRPGTNGKGKKKKPTSE